MPTKDDLAKMHWRDCWEYESKGEEMRQRKLLELREIILAKLEDGDRFIGEEARRAGPV
jgi:hypothetical protein